MLRETPSGIIVTNMAVLGREGRTGGGQRLPTEESVGPTGRTGATETGDGRHETGRVPDESVKSVHRGNNEGMWSEGNNDNHRAVWGTGGEAVAHLEKNETARVGPWSLGAPHAGGMDHNRGGGGKGDGGRGRETR